MDNEQWKPCLTPRGYVVVSGIKKPVRCMSWLCPSCGPIKKLRLARRIARGFFNDTDIHAMTLTQKHGSTRNIMKDFQTWREIVKKRYGTRFDYFWVKEFTQRGQRHLHVLLQPSDDNFFTGSYRKDVKRISQIWSEVTLNESYRVWINKRRIENAAGYLFKYLSKAYHFEIRYRRKERRYGFSRNPGFKPVRELPILGDFWEIIGHPKCSPYEYFGMSEQEGIMFMEEYVDDNNLFAGQI